MPPLAIGAQCSRTIVRRGGRLKVPWRDGPSHVALKPLELLEKLPALIPRPYASVVVDHGVLAPNAKWRGEVVDFGHPQVEKA